MNLFWIKFLQIMNDKFNYQNNRGYTLLFSIIVSSVVLSIAAFILSASRKQFLLTTTASDSTIAVYASDSGAQCGVEAYFENQLSTSSPASISCESGLLSSPFEVLSSGSSGRLTGMNMKNENSPGITAWQTDDSDPIIFLFPNGSCSIITVTVGYDLTTNKHKTVVDSRGYNDSSSWPCNPTGPINPRAVERAIRLVYLD